MPPSQVNTGAKGLATPFPHRFVTLHHNCGGRAGSALLPWPVHRASGAILPPSPWLTPCRHQLQAPTPGLPRMVDGGEVSSAPPPLLPRRGEPVELR